MQRQSDRCETQCVLTQERQGGVAGLGVSHELSVGQSRSIMTRGPTRCAGRLWEKDQCELCARVLADLASSENQSPTGSDSARSVSRVMGDRRMWRRSGEGLIQEWRESATDTLPVVDGASRNCKYPMERLERTSRMTWSIVHIMSSIGAGMLCQQGARWSVRRWHSLRFSTMCRMRRRQCEK